jgi:hypothetical protein
MSMKTVKSGSASSMGDVRVHDLCSAGRGLDWLALCAVALVCPKTSQILHSPLGLYNYHICLFHVCLSLARDTPHDDSLIKP